jgi:DNA polymerase-3 subunit beta
LRSLLEVNYATELRVSTSELVSVAKRVSLVAERNSQLRLRFDADGLVVEAGGAEDAKASEAMDCEYSGEAMKVAFNPQYLLDGLSAIAAPVAVFSFGPANKGVVLTGDRETGAEDSADYGSFKYMLQPLRFDS